MILQCSGFQKISNFTDMDAFERMNEVSIRYVSKPTELKQPDMVILPGTKNTIDDLLWMRQNGLEAAVLKLASKAGACMGNLRRFPDDGRMAGGRTCH